MSLPAVTDETAELAAAVERLSGRLVRRIVPVEGGRNNLLLRADTDDGPIAVKHYPKDRTELRDRLSVEYEALSFLVVGGVEAVPRPLARDDDQQLALYEWIEGRRIECPDEAAIDAAVAALHSIHRLAAIGRAGGWSRRASASIFCPAEAVEQIRARRSQFDADSAHSPGLGAFLTQFDSITAVVIRRARALARSKGIAWDVPLPAEQRTLSPSDFGFHNALRREDGSIVFLDFEYFGWDDPAKLCNDFLLHPGMALPKNLAVRFEVGIRALYGGADPYFLSRLGVMYLLCGLCWCMILLNGFLAIPRRSPDRVKQAGLTSVDLQAQLDKAVLLLTRIDNFRLKLVESEL